MSIVKMTQPAIDDLDAKVLGAQKTKIETELTAKELTKTKASAVVVVDLDEESLWDELQVKVVNSVNPSAVRLVQFDTAEEAETIGLRLDARAEGVLGVGIKGNKVSFWRRTT